MDIGTALRSLALADAAAAAIFGTRGYPLRLPQAVTYPAFTYQIVAGRSEYSHDGPSNLTESRVQFDVYAPTYDAMSAAAKALKRALDGKKANVGSPPEIEVGGVFWINEIDWPVPETDRSATPLSRRVLECTAHYSELD